MTSQLFASLAIIKVNWEQGQDYIENFVPFVAECLRTAPQSEVSLPQLQTAIAQEFGLGIPQGALKVILTRAKRKGYVTQAHGTYHRNETSLAHLTLAKDRTRALRQHEELVQKLIRFCETCHQTRWTEEKAENVLHVLLQNYSSVILAAAVEGLPIPEPDRVDARDRYIVHSFVLHLSEEDTVGFDFLETLVKGCILANALLYPDLNQVQQRLERVEFYFDTNFLLRALGLSGPGFQSPCRELLKLLYEVNGNLRCFEHTLEELQGVLEAAAYALQSHSPGAFETYDYLLSTGKTTSDVELIIATLENRLRSLRIEVEPKPAYDHDLGIDEDRLNQVLQDAMGYYSETARQLDVDSLAAIHRLRNGRFPRRFESCRAVFVTTNTALAAASTHFFREEYVTVPIPPCISDHVLTTLIWLKNPNRAQGLPRKRIFADCYAALNPPDSLWRLYLQEVDRLAAQGDISEDDCHLLRFSTEAKRILMDVTCGSTEVFTEGTPIEVLERAKANVRAETEAVYQAEKERRIAAEQQAQELKTEMRARRERQVQRYQELGTTTGLWISRVVLVVAIAVFAIGAYISLPMPLPDLPGELWKLATPLVLMVVALFGIGNAVFGTTVIAYTRQLEVKVATAIEKFLRRIVQI